MPAFNPETTNIELTYREFLCIQSVLNRQPDMKDGLTTEADNNLLAAAEALGKLNHDDKRRIKFGRIDKQTYVYLTRLLSIHLYHQTKSPETDVLARAYAGQISAWNELFGETCKN